jgi:alpha-galactosidase
LTPGIGVAPFAVQPASRLFQEHPEWMVKDAAGKPLSLEVPKELGGPCYALDGSDAGVEAWLADLFAELRDCGFRHFKLDLLFLGCVPGLRARPGTRVEAYRRGLSAIRAGAGDAYLLGCAAPYPASIGLVDGVRVGRDVHGAGGFRDSFRETHHRFWAHRALWNNDPGALIVRETEGSEAASASADSAVLSGGAVCAGDSLPQLPPDRLAILSRAVGGSRFRAAVPLDLFEREHPRMLAIPLGGRRFRVGLFNDGDVPRSLVLDLGRLGINRAKVVRADGDAPLNLGLRWKSVLLPPIPARGAVVLEIDGG